MPATCSRLRAIAQIGIDHFAKPGDPLAKTSSDGALKRNFQGYTTDDAGTLIGLGASSISTFAQGYVQNVVPVADYRRAIETDGLAGVRGIELQNDDRCRAYVIERLMCDFEFSLPDLEQLFGLWAEPVCAQAREISENDADGLVKCVEGRFSLTAKGRPFVRSICAQFDAYMARSRARHSIAV